MNKAHGVDEMPQNVLNTTLGESWDRDYTLQDELGVVDEKISYCEWEIEDDRITRFVGWTKNNIVVLMDGANGQYIDVIPKKP